MIPHVNKLNIILEYNIEDIFQKSKIKNIENRRVQINENLINMDGSIWDIQLSNNKSSKIKENKEKLIMMMIIIPLFLIWKAWVSNLNGPSIISEKRPTPTHVMVTFQIMGIKKILKALKENKNIPHRKDKESKW